ncbi:hypothetical protein BS47DRAFT_1287155 [Hydnum rufescens UP504]|uniref:cysteine synthase n=1 Tax=Hydnum rufescens UP504 TaxID=1448309 RepID=A0A9P6BA14_9AGAM|nr:hypothetical protein BS47DRAFT_1287155 [Hydnum rufescens UP504]
MTTWSDRLSNWVGAPARISHAILVGVTIGASLSVSSISLLSYLYHRQRLLKDSEDQKESSPRPIELRGDGIVDGVAGSIGRTPLLRINSLSNVLGVEILGKAEFLNPGGSVKDRVALRIIDDAEQQGLLYPNQGFTIFEGTVGSTGISIATIAKARSASIIMPDDVAEEKSKALEALGARVEKVRPASIVDKKQFVNLAKQRALEYGKAAIHRSNDVTVSTAGNDDNLGSRSDPLVRGPRGFFADQFENRSNFDAHYEGTGPEIWQQTNGDVDAFVCGAGTGGTIAGIGKYLKEMNPEVRVVLADPEGSGLYNKIKFGVMFDKKESEGTKRRHQVDTVVEGIGINRLTKNFELGIPVIDDAYRITDAEAISMSRYLVQNDGLFLGSSSACNLVACVRLAKTLGRGSGSTITTILCDSGTRHYSKVNRLRRYRNDAYLENAGIPNDPNIMVKLLHDD